jgi:hypothetical protein
MVIRGKGQVFEETKHICDGSYEINQSGTPDEVPKLSGAFTIAGRADQVVQLVVLLKDTSDLVLKTETGRAFNVQLKELIHYDPVVAIAEYRIDFIPGKNTQL